MFWGELGIAILGFSVPIPSVTAFRQQKNFALDGAQRQDARAALSQLPEGMTLEDAVRLAKLGASFAGERVTMADATSRFLHSRTDHKLRGATLVWYESKLKPILTILGDRHMDAITRTHLQDVIGSLPNTAAATKAAHLRAVRALWRWAKGQAPALVGKDVTEGMAYATSKTDSDGAEFLSVADVTKILHGLPAKHLPAVSLLIFAGIRPQELAGAGKPPMLWRHIDCERKTVRVESKISKTRQARVLEGLPDAFWAWLGKPGEPEAPIATAAAQQIIRRIQRAGGFWAFASKGRKGIRARKTFREWPHDATRHTFATYHLNHFDDPGRTALLLGHGGNPRMLYTHYRGLTNKADAAAFWALRP